MPAPQRGHSVPQSQLPQGGSRSPRQVTAAYAPATQVGLDGRIKLQFDPLTHRLRVQHRFIEGIPLRSAANTREDDRRGSQGGSRAARACARGSTVAGPRITWKVVVSMRPRTVGWASRPVSSAAARSVRVSRSLVKQ
jgi:hypothetical protein